MACTRALGELYRTHGGYEHVCWFSCYSLSLLSPQCLTHCNCSLNEKKEGKSQKVLEQWQEGTSFPSRGRATSTQWRTQATKRWASEVQCTEQRVGTYLQSLGAGWGTWTESMSQGSQETLCVSPSCPPVLKEENRELQRCCSQTHWATLSKVGTHFYSSDFRHVIVDCSGGDSVVCQKTLK